MADLNQRFYARIQTLRNTMESGNPTQVKDSTTSVNNNLATVRVAADLAKGKEEPDRDGQYYLGLP